MGEYVFVIHPVAPVRQHLIYTLAKAGWLVTAPEDAAVERQAERNGPPAVLIRSGLDDPIAEPTYSRQNGSPPRVLAVLTEEESDLGQFAQGHLVDADDFLLWPADDAEILLRVRRLAEAPARVWRPAPPPRDQGDGPKHFAGRSDNREETRSHRLSRIEREIMRRLEAAGGAVVPIATLADSIAAESPERQMSTLRVHISRLRKKLELDPRQPSRIVTVRGVGYRLGQ